MAKAIDIYVIHPPGDMSVWELARRSLTELAALGGAGDADIRAHRRCRGYRLHTTAAQASVWMADEVQDELAGYEFMQWPIAGDTSFARSSSMTRRHGENQRPIPSSRPSATCVRRNAVDHSMARPDGRAANSNTSR
jgi:hypothetical protein